MLGPAADAISRRLRLLRRRGRPTSADTMFKGAGRKRAPPVASRTPVKQPRIGALSGGAAPPPLRGAAASRSTALATFHGLVAAECGAPAPPGSPHHTDGGGGARCDRGDPRLGGSGAGASPHGPTPRAGSSPAQSLAEAGAARAPEARERDEQQLEEGRRQQGRLAAQAPARTARDSDPAARTRRLALELQRTADALRACARRLASQGAAYLYQHAEDVAGARRQLAACVAALPGGADGAEAAGAAGLAPQLFDAASCCWVRRAWGDPVHAGSFQPWLHCCCRSHGSHGWARSAHAARAWCAVGQTADRPQWRRRAQDVCCAILGHHAREAGAADEAEPFHDAARCACEVLGSTAAASHGGMNRLHGVWPAMRTPPAKPCRWLGVDPRRRMWELALAPCDDALGGAEPEAMIEMLTPIAQVGSTCCCAPAAVALPGRPHC